MYRNYENPYKLEKQLAELKGRYVQATDEDEQISLAESSAELKDRINFTWQNDEEDCQ